MPSALVFDAYGTLFDVHSVQARCEALWPGKGAALSQMWRAKQLEYTWQRSLMRRYAPFSQVTDDALVFSCEFLKLKIEKDAKQSLLDPLVAQSGLAFDAVLSVDELKVYKPAPEVYQLAVDRLKTPKEEIGFVSSNGWDAQGAKSFGFTVYWINRAGAPVDRLGFPPDRIVKSLDEILL